MATAHERYRDRLSVLADDALVTEVVRSWIGDANRVEWSRHFGRFDPSRSPWATLVHQPAGPGPMITIDAFEQDAAPADAIASPAGPLRLRRFPDDPELAPLAEVIAGLPAHDVIRYRPGKRCTLRTQAPDGTRYVKVLDITTAARIAEDAVRLWDLSVDGAVAFRVARFARLDAERGAVWHHVAPGMPIADQLFAGPPVALELVESIGVALGSLGVAPIRSATTTGRRDQSDRTARAVARAKAVVPELGPDLESAVRHLEDDGLGLPTERVVPIHGAPHQHQWLVDDGGLSLVDFDRFALGEPELDVATFLAELEAEDQLVVPIDDVEATLIAGFESVGPPLDREVIEWYLSHKRLAKVTRTARAVRPDGDRRAARHLERVAGRRI